MGKSNPFYPFSGSVRFPEVVTYLSELREKTETMIAAIATAPIAKSRSMEQNILIEKENRNS